MFLKLRILFTVLSALCLAVIVPAFVWGGFPWLAIVGSCALLFFALMLLCKQSQEKREEEKKPEADFLNPSTNESKPVDGQKTTAEEKTPSVKRKKL